MGRGMRIAVGLLVTAVWLAACGDGGGEPTFEEQDLELTGEDFECILGWEKVRRFYVTNKLDRIDETLEVAQSPTGGTYPPGTLIQLVPSEAMYKRGPGWNPETNDWEFFALDVSEEGTTIVSRGAEETENQFGGNCFECHRQADPQWDLICEQDHGCDPLPIDAETIELVQSSDPRCP
ncbi:MAG: hypothetical protein ACODAU_01260 [Myxococcota bacterium]